MDSRLAQLTEQWELYKNTNIVSGRHMYEYDSTGLKQTSGYDTVVDMAVKKHFIDDELKNLAENSQDSKYDKRIEILENMICQYEDKMILNALKK